MIYHSREPVRLVLKMSCAARLAVAVLSLKSTCGLRHRLNFNLPFVYLTIGLPTTQP